MEDVLFSKLSPIITTNKMQVSYQASRLLSKRSIVLIDIDDCITTPTSNFFRNSSNERKLLRNLERNMFSYSPFKESVESFYLHAKYRLVNHNWPDLISRLQQITPHIFLLSQKFPGSFGSIKNMELLEYWRLQQLGIELGSLSMNKKDYLKMNYTGVNDYSAVYYKGVILQGKASSNVILRDILYIQDLIPDKILYISSNNRALKDVKKLADARKVPFQGIKYNGSLNLNGTSNPKFIQLQKRIFLEKKRWIEDKQLLELLQK